MPSAISKIEMQESIWGCNGVWQRSLKIGMDSGISKENMCYIHQMVEPIIESGSAARMDTKIKHNAPK